MLISTVTQCQTDVIKAGKDGKQWIIFLEWVWVLVEKLCLLIIIKEPHYAANALNNWSEQLLPISAQNTMKILEFNNPDFIKLTTFKILSNIVFHTFRILSMASVDKGWYSGYWYILASHIFFNIDYVQSVQVWAHCFQKAFFSHVQDNCMQIKQTDWCC